MREAVSDVTWLFHNIRHLLSFLGRCQTLYFGRYLS